MAPRSRSFIFVVGSLLLFFLVPPPAFGLPITLQARSKIELVTERAERGLYLRGKLVDDAGSAISSEVVRFEVTGLHLPAVRTDSQGRFEYFIPAAHLIEVEPRHGAEVPWTATFLGDPHYGAAKASGKLDLRRVPTLLTLDIKPRSVTVDADWLMVRAQLLAEEIRVSGAAIKLRVGKGSEQQGRTDTDGLVRFRVRPADLDTLGDIKVRARFAGDHHRAVSEATSSFTVQRSSRITLRVGREGEAATGRYRFSGRLVDAHGPIARATIAIVATQRKHSKAGIGPFSPVEPRAVAVGTTDANGIFLTALPARTLFANTRGIMELRALYQPQQASQAAAQSRPVVVPVPSPPGVPTRWYVAGILWVLAGLAMAHIARNRLWRVLIEALRERRKPRELKKSVDLTIEEPPFIEAAGGRGTPARRDWVAGIVVDAHSGNPVALASVAVVGAGQSYEVAADAFGHFELRILVPGAYRLVIGATQYLGREVVVQFPHEGFLDDAVFKLVAVRRRIRDLYGNAMVRCDNTWIWGQTTPREALAGAQPTPANLGAEQQLTRLRDLTEHAWYTDSGAQPGHAVEAAGLLDEVRERLPPSGTEGA